jgi:hypothetical protein
LFFCFCFFPFQSSQVQKIKGKICNKQLCYPTTGKQNWKKKITPNIFKINGDPKNSVRRNVNKINTRLSQRTHNQDGCAGSIFD